MAHNERSKDLRKGLSGYTGLVRESYPLHLKPDQQHRVFDDIGRLHEKNLAVSEKRLSYSLP
jgi:hypothetical protein